MDLIERFKSKARAHPQRIILPEGEDERVISAAARVTAERYAQITLLGRTKIIRATADRAGEKLDGIEVLDPLSSPRVSAYAEIYLERRPAREITHEKAQEFARKPLYFAALSVAAGDADSTVGGAANSTSDTIRAALHSIGFGPGARGR